MFQCGNLCGTIYCSQQCAATDWNHHEAVCLIEGGEKRLRDDESSDISMEDLVGALKVARVMGNDKTQEIEAKLLDRLNAENMDLIFTVIDPNEKELLHRAVGHDDVELVKLLVKHPKVDINRRDASGRTALMLAFGFYALIAIKTLLLAHPKINVNLQDENGETALIHAIFNGTRQDVQMLLSQPNINVNLQNFEGNTALILATEHVDDISEEPLRELLTHPTINVNLQNHNGLTALMVAVQTPSKDGIIAIGTHPDTDFFIKDNSGNIVTAYTTDRETNLLVFSLIERQKYSIFPHDMSKMMALRRLRNHLCETLSDESNLVDLKDFAHYLRLPIKENITKGEICLAISDLLAVGTRYNQEMYEKARQTRINLLKYEKQRMLSIMDSFKEGLQVFAGIDTNGKTTEQLFQELDRALN